MSLILNLEHLRSSILNLDSKKKCLLSVLVSISTLSVALSVGLVIQNVYSLSHPDKGYIFSNYLDEVKMYVKNVSYTDSLVVVEFRGDLYKMRLESVSMTNLTLGLEKVESDSYYWNSDGVLRLETGESCVYHNISTYRPSNLPSSYPKPGVYVSSTGYRPGLISAYYSSGYLIARKMTGSVFVPAGVETFKIDLETLQVDVLHANRRFHNPHWTSNYRVARMNQTEIDIVSNRHSDSRYVHLERFAPRT